MSRLRAQLMNGGNGHMARTLQKVSVAVLVLSRVFGFTNAAQAKIGCQNKRQTRLVVIRPRLRASQASRTPPYVFLRACSTRFLFVTTQLKSRFEDCINKNYQQQ
jgi:hypothetical protein